MILPASDFRRTLGVDPTSRGLGFVVLEGNDHLVDWGAVTFAGRHRNERCLAYLTRIIDRYHPDAVVSEDIKAPGCRRCPRVRILLVDIKALAVSRKLSWRTIARLEMPNKLGMPTRTNKQRVAQLVAERLPVLVPWLPPPRKTWMSEDPRMGIFDAAALALAVQSNT